MRATFSFLALAAAVSAATISINVGEDGALKFDPDSVTANIGDLLEFHFYSGTGGHSVVSSTFSTPCVPATDAFFSGYITGNDSGDQTFVVAVNSTDPIWFYCSLGSHCQAGMVGVVNPPSGQSASDYAMAAQSVMKASAPAAMQGGVLSTITASAAATTNTEGRQSGAGSVTMTSMSSASGATTNTVGRQSSGASIVTGTTTTSGAVGSNTVSRNVGSSSTSTSASAATTSASAGVGRRESSDVGAVMGLAVFAGGLVALMA